MAHYFDEQPEAASDVRNIQFSLEGRMFDLLTDRGVFSKGGLDIGTAVLLRALIRDLRQHPLTGRLLDLGCGYGPVGVVLKRVFPGIELTMTDVNQRALELARQNLKRNGVHYAEVMASDGYAALAGQTFDLIVTNPPIRAGKRTVYSFFDGAAAHLNPGGRLYVVMGKKQGAPSAERHLTGQMGNCARIERDAGFWVMRCDRPGKGVPAAGQALS